MLHFGNSPNSTTHSTDIRRLGRSGLKISKVILGAMSYGDPTQGNPWTLPEDQAVPLLYHAYKRGINTWDTADIYGQGTSELLIARAIKDYAIPRSRLVLLTKLFFGVDPEIVQSGELNFEMAMKNDGHMVNRVGLSRKHIFDAVDASVERYVIYCFFPGGLVLTGRQVGHVYRCPTDSQIRSRYTP